MARITRGPTAAWNAHTMARINIWKTRAGKPPSLPNAHTMARINIWKTRAGKPPSLPNAHTMARIFENRRRRAFDTLPRTFDTVVRAFDTQVDADVRFKSFVRMISRQQPVAHASKHRS